MPIYRLKLSKYALGHSFILKKISRKKQRFLRLFLDKYSSLFRIFTATFALIAIVVLTFQSLNPKEISEAKAHEDWESEGEVLGVETVSDMLMVTSPSGIEYSVTPPTDEDFVRAQEKYEEKLRLIEEQKRREEEAKRREKMIKVTALQDYLRRMGSPMAPYAELIYDSCIPHGVHFCKYYLSISGVESGFGRVPIGCCNAWGILGVTYPSWEVSIPRVSNWLATTYYYRFPTFEALSQSGYHGGDQEARAIWVGNLYSFYNKIPLY